MAGHRLAIAKTAWQAGTGIQAFSLPGQSFHVEAVPMRVADLIRLLAIVFVAICLVPAGAHLFEMFNKMALPPAEYMVVQQIYAGWALFGIAIAAALALTLAHTLMVWRHPAARWPSLLAFLAIVATQVIFWTYTYPMNALTQNWTVMPQDLESARRQWEYSHTLNAGITLVALILIVVAVLTGCRQDLRERSS
jgi:MFS family permease